MAIDCAIMRSLRKADGAARALLQREMEAIATNLKHRISKLDELCAENGEDSRLTLAISHERDRRSLGD